MREFRYTAAIVMIPLLLSMLACGDEDSAATSACGSCPEGYYCASGDDGYFCQASADQGQTSNVTEDRPSQDRDRPSDTRPQESDNSDDASLFDDFTSDDDGDDGDDNSSPPPHVDDSDDGACEEVRLALKPTSGSIPRVMLVVDRSYSMIVDEDRWSPIEQTLSRVTEALNDTVHFGLVLFPATNPGFGSDAEMACAAGEVNVSPGASTADDIHGWLMNEPPQPGLAQAQS